MPPIKVPPILAAALLAAATACSDGAEQAAMPEAPTFEGVIDLEIGELDGEDPYLFTNIGDVVADDRGRLIVADIQSGEIRVFEPDGSFAFRFGGHGEGPGELTDPCCLEFGPDGALWVRESARYSVFTLGATDAEYQRSLMTPHLGTVGVMAPLAFDAEGNLVSVGPVRPEDGESVTARLHVGADGVVDTVIAADPERQSSGQTTVQRTIEMAGRQVTTTLYLHQPLGPDWIHAHAGDGRWAEAVTSEYSITYHMPDGTVSSIEGPAFQGPTLSPDERAWAQDWIDSQLERADLAEHPFGIPERKPPLASMFFDRDGRLWVEKTAADGEAMREADVYEGTTLVARYRWPQRIQDWPRPWADESVLYGVTADALGVQRVVRVRFSPTG